MNGNDRQSNRSNQRSFGILVVVVVVSVAKPSYTMQLSVALVAFGFFVLAALFVTISQRLLMDPSFGDPRESDCHDTLSGSVHARKGFADPLKWIP